MSTVSKTKRGRAVKPTNTTSPCSFSDSESAPSSEFEDSEDDYKMNKQKKRYHEKKAGLERPVRSRDHETSHLELFKLVQYPEKPQREEEAKKTGRTEIQVKEWFRYKRIHIQTRFEKRGEELPWQMKALHEMRSTKIQLEDEGVLKEYIEKLQMSKKQFLAVIQSREKVDHKKKHHEEHHKRDSDGDDGKKDGRKMRKAQRVQSKKSASTRNRKRHLTSSVSTRREGQSTSTNQMRQDVDIDHDFDNPLPQPASSQLTASTRRKYQSRSKNGKKMRSELD